MTTNFRTLKNFQNLLYKCDLCDFSWKRNSNEQNLFKVKNIFQTPVIFAPRAYPQDTTHARTDTQLTICVLLVFPLSPSPVCSPILYRARARLVSSGTSTSAPVGTTSGGVSLDGYSCGYLE